MCDDNNGCCQNYCEPEELSPAEQEVLLEKRIKILEAELDAAKKLKELVKKSNSGK